ncbi:hypothetical protein PIB30_088404 [Stylosanthes scabra]|uniref:Uncharacterized protein n=1 Tax=Stylosanthes scabra TaxID=79078 RepID=A0ABU6SV69_9FABA|nr:hypothetical protein [Stylosanthes scabra]
MRILSIRNETEQILGIFVSLKTRVMNMDMLVIIVRVSLLVMPWICCEFLGSRTHNNHICSRTFGSTVQLPLCAVLLAVAVNLRPSSLTPHVAEPSTERELGERESERELGERIRPPSRSRAVLLAVGVNLHPSSLSYSLSCLIVVAPDLGRPLRLRHFCRSHRRSEKRVRESTVNGSVAVNLPRRASTVQISQADPSVKQP